MRKLVWVLVVLTAALGLTAIASGSSRIVVTGANIKDHSVTTRDLVDHTIRAHDLAPALVQYLQGHAGPQGVQGLKGDTGPQGARGPTGLTGATGSPGLSGYQVVAGDPVTVSPNLIHAITVQAMCPPGKVPLGGGVSLSNNDAGVLLKASYPVWPGEGVGWAVVFTYPIGPKITVTPYVICAYVAD
jgi:hypothetical protein